MSATAAEYREVRLLDADQNVLAVNAKGKHSYLFTLRVDGVAGFEIESPRVPGAYNRIAFNPTLSERALAMRAKVIERSQVSLEAGQAYLELARPVFADHSFRRSLADST